MGKIKNYYYEKNLFLKNYMVPAVPVPSAISVSTLILPAPSTVFYSMVPTVMELALSITSKDDLKSWSYHDIAIFFTRQAMNPFLR